MVQANEQPQEKNAAMKSPKQSPGTKPSVQAPPSIKDKTQIGRRLTEAVDASPVTNRSADLVPLNREYNLLHNRLRSLTAALRAHHASMAQLDKTQMEVVKEVAEFSAQSPIHSHVAGAAAGTTAKSPNSYVGVYEALSKNNKQEMSKYQATILDYVLEWDRVVTNRVEGELKETHRLNGILNHYQTKVDSLRKDINRQLDKGKQSPARKTDKLKRNEEKLKVAWEEHERSASRLCDLLQAATEHGWKDLFPLVVAMSKFDAEKSTKEQSILSKMEVIQTLLLSTAKEDHAKPPPPPEEESSSDEGSEDTEVRKGGKVTPESASSEDSEDQSVESLVTPKKPELASPTAVAEYEKKGASDGAPAMPALQEV